MSAFGNGNGLSGVAVADSFCGAYGATARTVIFRPGFRSPKVGPNQNVFSNWACAVAACRAIVGPKVLLFDPTDGPLVIPPGHWDFGDGEVGWFMPICRLVVSLDPFPTPAQAVLTVRDGASFSPNICAIDGAFDLRWYGTTQPMLEYTPASVPRTIVLRNGCLLKALGTQPVFHVQPGTTTFVLTGLGANFVTPNVAAVEGSFYCILSSYCNLNPDSLRGSGTVFIQRSAANAFFPGLAAFPNLMGPFDAESPNLGAQLQRSGAPSNLTDSKALGYFAGDTWLDASGPAAYVCVQSSPTGAVWLQIG